MTAAEFAEALPQLTLPVTSEGHRGSRGPGPSGEAQLARFSRCECPISKSACSCSRACPAVRWRACSWAGFCRRIISATKRRAWSPSRRTRSRSCPPWRPSRRHAAGEGRYARVAPPGTRPSVPRPAPIRSSPCRRIRHVLIQHGCTKCDAFGVGNQQADHR